MLVPLVARVCVRVSVVCGVVCVDVRLYSSVYTESVMFWVRGNRLFGTDRGCVG